MRPNAQPRTIRPASHRIAIITRIIQAQLAGLIARPARKAAAHFVADADAQGVAGRAAAGRVRVCDAGVAGVAGEGACAAAAADFVRVDGLGWGCGCGAGFLD